MSRPTTLLAALAAALLLVLGGALTGAASATTSPGTTTDGPTGWLRVGHLSPGTPKAEVRLTPFSGGDPIDLAEASFGDLSGYERLPVGLYTVALLPDGQPDGSPMLSRSVEIFEGGARTVIATGEGDDVRATVLDDDLTPPAAGQAKVRLVSAATDVDALDATVVGGPDLANGLGTGDATGYADVPAQAWDVRLAASDSEDGGDDSRVTVQAGGVYTLVALDTPQGGLELRAVKDSAGSTGETGAMPTGGVDAGGGGLAAHGGESPSLAPALATSGVLLALAGAVAVRRKETA